MTSTQHSRDRGNLFENGDKRKPSQPDMRGDCKLDGKPYVVSAWKRHDQLSVAIAPPRDGGGYPPDAFRGDLDEARHQNGDSGPKLAWLGNVVGDDSSYAMKAFEKTGKSGPYLALAFEPIAE